jgi:ABC-type glycerol-3-phosphate transport system substrate-binding protein
MSSRTKFQSLAIMLAVALVVAACSSSSTNSTKSTVTGSQSPQANLKPYQMLAIVPLTGSFSRARA